MASKTFTATAVATGVALALGSAPPTMAQDQEVEEIVVTGSHIRRTEYEGRAPIQIVDSQAIEMIGAAQPVDVLKQLSVNSGSEFYNETNNRAGSSQFNIRNLGLGSTLTLINGKRAGIAPVASEAGTDFFDMNQLPLAMIERIEVLTDGASATYGSQAVAGVANIITRKGFEGLEVSGGYSASEINAWHLNMAAGAGFDRGHFNIYATYYEQGRMDRSQFDWLDDRLNGAGIPGRSRFLSGTGSPGSSRRATLDPVTGEATDVAGAIQYPDPDCEAAGGVIGDPLDTGLAANTCRYNFADQVSVISAEQRAQVFTEFNYEITDKVNYYVEASFSDNQIFRNTGGQLLATGKATNGGTTILPSHPFNFFVEDPVDPTALQYIGPAAWDPTIHCTDINSAPTCQFQTATLRNIHRPLGPDVTGTALTPEIQRTMQYNRILQGLEIGRRTILPASARTCTSRWSVTVPGTRSARVSPTRRWSRPRTFPIR
jgi:iron complex outermembrane receptor protein